MPTRDSVIKGEVTMAKDLDRLREKIEALQQRKEALSAENQKLEDDILHWCRQDKDRMLQAVQRSTSRMQSAPPLAAPAWKRKRRHRSSSPRQGSPPTEPDLLSSRPPNSSAAPQQEDETSCGVARWPPSPGATPAAQTRGVLSPLAAGFHGTELGALILSPQEHPAEVGPAQALPSPTVWNRMSAVSPIYPASTLSPAPLRPPSLSTTAVDPPRTATTPAGRDATRFSLAQCCHAHSSPERQELGRVVEWTAALSPLLSDGMAPTHREVVMLSGFPASTGSHYKSRDAADDVGEEKDFCVSPLRRSGGYAFSPSSRSHSDSRPSPSYPANKNSSHSSKGSSSRGSKTKSVTFLLQDEEQKDDPNLHPRTTSSSFARAMTEDMELSSIQRHRESGEHIRLSMERVLNQLQQCRDSILCRGAEAPITGSGRLLLQESVKDVKEKVEECVVEPPPKLHMWQRSGTLKRQRVVEVVDFDSELTALSLQPSNRKKTNAPSPHPPCSGPCGAPVVEESSTTTKEEIVGSPAAVSPSSFPHLQEHEPEREKDQKANKEHYHGHDRSADSGNTRLETAPIGSSLFLSASKATRSSAVAKKRGGGKREADSKQKRHQEKDKKRKKKDKVDVVEADDDAVVVVWGNDRGEESSANVSLRSDGSSLLCTTPPHRTHTPPPPPPSSLSSGLDSPSLPSAVVPRKEQLPPLLTAALAKVMAGIAARDQQNTKKGVQPITAVHGMQPHDSPATTVPKRHRAHSITFTEDTEYLRHSHATRRLRTSPQRYRARGSDVNPRLQFPSVLFERESGVVEQYGAVEGIVLAAGPTLLLE